MEQYMAEALTEEFGAFELTRSRDDLVMLQKWFRLFEPEPDQILYLQGAGVLLGNVLQNLSSARWARVENQFGDQLALQHAKSGLTLYPLSMISKRVEDGREIDLPALCDDLLMSLRDAR